MKKLLAIILMLHCISFSSCFGYLTLNPIDTLINKYPVKEYVKDGVFVVGTIQSMITLLTFTAAMYHGTAALFNTEYKEEYSLQCGEELKDCAKAAFNTFVCIILFKALLEK